MKAFWWKPLAGLPMWAWPVILAGTVVLDELYHWWWRSRRRPEPPGLPLAIGGAR